MLTRKFPGVYQGQTGNNFRARFSLVKKNPADNIKDITPRLNDWLSAYISDFIFML